MRIALDVRQRRRQRLPICFDRLRAAGTLTRPNRGPFIHLNLPCWPQRGCRRAGWHAHRNVCAKTSPLNRRAARASLCHSRLAAALEHAFNPIFPLLIFEFVLRAMCAAQAMPQRSLPSIAVRLEVEQPVHAYQRQPRRASCSHHGPMAGGSCHRGPIQSYRIKRTAHI